MTATACSSAIIIPDCGMDYNNARIDDAAAERSPVGGWGDG